MSTRRALALVAVVAVAVGCSGTSSSSSPSSTSLAPTTITLLTHDSFDVSKPVLQAFEDQTGITVKIVAVGDAGQLANRLILDAGNPEGDVAFGIDNDQLADLFAHDVFTPYTPQGLDAVAQQYQAWDPDIV